LFLLAGLFRIGKVFIRSEGLIWVAILLPFSLFFSWNLGGNEMYIPLVTSSTVAKAIGIWGVYFFFFPYWFLSSASPLSDKLRNPSKEKSEGRNALKGHKLFEDYQYFWFAFVLLGMATFIQPLVGLQLFLILSGVQVINFLWEKKHNGFKKIDKTNWRIFHPLLFYLATAGVWVYFLQSHFASGTIDNWLLFDFLEFRLSHHFIPSYFSKKAAIVLLPLFAWSLFYYFKKSKAVFFYFVITLLGILIYTVGVEIVKNATIVSSQFFKATIWLKSFSFIALMATVESWIPFFQKNIVSKMMTWGIRLCGILTILLILNPVGIFKQRPYDFFFLNKNRVNSIIEIAQIAKAKTPKDAQFIIPIWNTRFKNYSERSTYIDFKAVIHRKAIIPIWYQRIQEIYGINVATKRSGKDIQAEADKNYRAITIEDLRRFHQRGIQYFLTYREIDLPLERVGQNDDYVIYKLDDLR
ncbi:MAG: DUF6798 domain-containing protein, partial [Bacteroidota bacterium]